MRDVRQVPQVVAVHVPGQDAQGAGHGTPGRVGAVSASSRAASTAATVGQPGAGGDGPVAHPVTRRPAHRVASRAEHHDARHVHGRGDVGAGVAADHYPGPGEQGGQGGDARAAGEVGHRPGAPPGDLGRHRSLGGRAGEEHPQAGGAQAVGHRREGPRGPPVGRARRARVDAGVGRAGSAAPGLCPERRRRGVVGRPEREAGVGGGVGHAGGTRHRQQALDLVHVAGVGDHGARGPPLARQPGRDLTAGAQQRGQRVAGHAAAVHLQGEVEAAGARPGAQVGGGAGVGGDLWQAIDADGHQQVVDERGEAVDEPRRPG